MDILPEVDNEPSDQLFNRHHPLYQSAPGARRKDSCMSPIVVMPLDDRPKYTDLRIHTNHQLQWELLAQHARTYVSALLLIREQEHRQQLYHQFGWIFQYHASLKRDCARRKDLLDAQAQVLLKTLSLSCWTPYVRYLINQLYDMSDPTTRWEDEKSAQAREILGTTTDTAPSTIRTIAHILLTAAPPKRIFPTDRQRRRQIDQEDPWDCSRVWESPRYRHQAVQTEVFTEPTLEIEKSDHTGKQKGFLRTLRKVFQPRPVRSNPPTEKTYHRYEGVEVSDPILESTSVHGIQHSPAIQKRHSSPFITFPHFLDLMAETPKAVNGIEQSRITPAPPRRSSSLNEKTYPPHQNPGTRGKSPVQTPGLIHRNLHEVSPGELEDVFPRFPTREYIDPDVAIKGQDAPRYRQTKKDVSCVCTKPQTATIRSRPSPPPYNNGDIRPWNTHVIDTKEPTILKEEQKLPVSLADITVHRDAESDESPLQGTPASLQTDHSVEAKTRSSSLASAMTSSDHTEQPMEQHHV